MVGGELARVTLSEATSEPASRSDQEVELLDLDRALEELVELEPRHARIVELRFFGRMTTDETAETLGVSTSSVVRGWRRARRRLWEELAREDP